MLTPTITPATRHRAGRRRRVLPADGPPTPPPSVLTLVAATYAAGAWVELTFDYAVDTSGFDGEQVLVDDGAAGLLWLGNGPVTRPTAASVRVGLTEFEPTGAGAITLVASAFTGITAAGGTGTWAGASNLLLPYST